MIILIFGTSNVGKSVTGEILAKKLNYSFVDMDIEIKKRFQTTLEKFIKDNPFSFDRDQIKGKLLKDLITDYKDNVVIAVSVIYYSRFFNPLLKLENIIAIELQDSEEHIFERLIFSDENDIIYKDDEYKEKYKKHYIKEIHEDIVYLRKIFNKIENKYFIDNRSVEEVADDLIKIIVKI